jgi:hypothetical protein
MADGEFLPKLKRVLFKLLAAVVILPAAGYGIWAWAALKFVYASGERSGYVQKLSKKGWLCKTWEGELAMSNVPGSAPQIFDFTVPDDKTAAEIQKRMGQRVSLRYEQHPRLPNACFGETSYFVTGAEVQDSLGAPAPPRPGGA